jgi:hypothetical protein
MFETKNDLSPTIRQEVKTSMFEETEALLRVGGCSKRLVRPAPRATGEPSRPCRRIIRDVSHDESMSIDAGADLAPNGSLRSRHFLPLQPGLCLQPPIFGVHLA